MVSEIFNASFLFSILLIIVSVAGLYFYFNRKFLEQNHKMQSMLGLVSTMAEEMQYFRSKILNSSVENNTNKTQIISNFLGENNNINNELIAVSDSEADSDADSDADTSLDADSDADDFTVDDESSTEEIEEIEEFPRKIINIDLGIDADNETTNFDIESEDITKSDTKTITVDIDNVHLEDHNLEDMDLSLKSISIDDNNVATNKNKEDYKKLSLNKLREALIEKGLITDSSKLKKNELLKLLDAE